MEWVGQLKLFQQPLKIKKYTKKLEILYTIFELFSIDNYKKYLNKQKSLDKDQNHNVLLFRC